LRPAALTKINGRMLSIPTGSCRPDAKPHW
jgi:hypothetical protein